MKLLDLFCGSGGAAAGYHCAGFTDIVGIDTRRQPRYPFDFVLADAFAYLQAHCGEFDVIHASPPCQAYSEATPTWARTRHPRLIAPLREALRLAGRPYVIENVAGARGELHCPLMLCGSMFGLPIWRHRYFEIEPLRLIFGPATCNHATHPVVMHCGSNTRRLMGPVSPTSSTRRRSGRFEWNVRVCREAMQVPWMSREGVDQAIPPAYTEFIGRQLLAHLRRAS